MMEMTVNATIDNIEKVTEFVDSFLEDCDCPMKIQMQVDIALDELLSNVAHYAYNPDVGEVTVRIEELCDPKRIAITIIDKGIPYDPLAKKDPDVSAKIEDREIGGLGIYMVKKSMDSMVYEYSDGQNVLTIEKKL